MTQEEKLQQLLEMQEHPECYTDEEIRQLMADEECRQLYEQMVRATDAVYAEKIKATPQSRRWLRVAATFLGVLMLSGIAYATIHLVRSNSRTEQVQAEIAEKSIVQQSALNVHNSESDTIRIFENAELQQILQELSAYYHIDVTFRNEQARHIRLYTKWNTSAPLATMIERLNRFEKVSVRLKNNRIIAE